jgi:hypothetical protein
LLDGSAERFGKGTASAAPPKAKKQQWALSPEIFRYKPDLKEKGPFHPGAAFYMGTWEVFIHF